MRKILSRWAPVLLWCVFIFVQSCLPADKSSLESGAVAGFLNNAAAWAFGPAGLHVSETLLRKTGHFIEYAVLGALLSRAFGADRAPYGMLPAVAAGIAYAATDEFHQHFVPGRSARFADICIDAAGMAAGALVFFILRHRAVQSNTDPEKTKT